MRCVVRGSVTDGRVQGVPVKWYAARVATLHPRIQVTVDDELDQALARIDPAPSSRSRLVRDLALRGALAIEQERAGAQTRSTVLLEIADGMRDYDLEASAELAARRGDRLR